MLRHLSAFKRELHDNTNAFFFFCIFQEEAGGSQSGQSGELDVSASFVLLPKIF